MSKKVVYLLIGLGIVAVAIIAIATPLGIVAANSATPPPLVQDTKTPGVTEPPPSGNNNTNNSNNNNNNRNSNNNDTQQPDPQNPPDTTQTQPEVIIPIQNAGGDYWQIDFPEEYSEILYWKFKEELEENEVYMFKLGDKYLIPEFKNIEIRLVFLDTLYILTLYKNGDS